MDTPINTGMLPRMHVASGKDLGAVITVELGRVWVQWDDGQITSYAVEDFTDEMDVFTTREALLAHHAKTVEAA